MTDRRPLEAGEAGGRPPAPAGDAGAPEVVPPSADELLALARAREDAARSRLADALGDLIDGRGGRLSDREWWWMTSIIRAILREVEMPVRRRLALSVSRLDGVPRALVRQLANEEIEIALPILQRSRLLADQDLVEVVLNRTREHAVAVARREDLSERVSDVLVDRGDPVAILALLRNPSAALSRHAVDYLAEQSRRVGEFQEPLLDRKELPRRLAVRMFAWVSASLQTVIRRRWNLEDPEVETALADAVEESRLRFEQSLDGPTAAARFAAALDAARAGGLPAAVALLEQGHVALFMEILQRATGVRPVLLRRLVHEESGECLAILLRAVAVAPQDVARVFMLTRGEPLSGADEGMRTRAVYIDALAAVTATDVARIVLRHWARDADFQAALRRIEEMQP
jgi:uncharacterized protein (DUF2336 family)